MYNLEGDATNRMVNLSVEMMNSGFKLGGTLAKETLILVLEKVKETQENKIGLMSIKKLLKSKDELNVVNLGRGNLEFFKSEAKKLGVGFASVSDKDSGNLKIIYKTKDVGLVKNIMQEILEKSKNENIVEEINDKSIFNFLKNIDFKEHNENAYRFEVDKIYKEKALAINDLLLVSGIKNSIVVKKIQDDGKVMVDFKVNMTDKEKAITLINDCRDISLDDIYHKINDLRKEKGLENEDEPKKEIKKVPLTKLVENADKQLKDEMEKKRKAMEESKNRKKSKQRYNKNKDKER